LPENVQQFKKTLARDYECVSKKLNMTEFLNTFRETTFDKWGFSYNKIKPNIYDWKVQHYAPYLNKNGSFIFESACGIGLNLYMTFEILQEAAGIEEVVVYGKESNKLFDCYPPVQAKKGQISTSNLMDLIYIPAKSFD
jgi:hypothetical protein